MSWASGSFTRIFGATGWVDDKNAATNILSSRHDTHDQDIADGINACITRDNQAKPTADFLPAITATYNIGSAGVKWIAGFFSGNLSAANITTGSFTGTLTGMVGATTGTITYQIAGSIVTLTAHSAITGVSNSTDMTMTGIPAAIQSANQKTMSCWGFEDNGGVAFSCGQPGVAVLNGGTLQFFLMTNSNPVGPKVFTNSAGKGLFAGWTVSYTLD